MSLDELHPWLQEQRRAELRGDMVDVPGVPPGAPVEPEETLTGMLIARATELGSGHPIYRDIMELVSRLRAWEDHFAELEAKAQDVFDDVGWPIPPEEITENGGGA